MNFLGQPVVVQNTDGPNWLVTWNSALTHAEHESVSFTVAVPRRAELTIAEVQRYAIKRAIQLLQDLDRAP